MIALSVMKAKMKSQGAKGMLLPAHAAGTLHNNCRHSKFTMTALSVMKVKMKSQGENDNTSAGASVLERENELCNNKYKDRELNPGPTPC